MEKMFKADLKKSLAPTVKEKVRILLRTGLKLCQWRKFQLEKVDDL